MTNYGAIEVRGMPERDISSLGAMGRENSSSAVAAAAPPKVGFQEVRFFNIWALRTSR